jgi:L-lactate dehydrogenase complex protein LldG
VSPTARDEILARIERARPGAPTALSVPRRYRRDGTLDHEQRVELFCRRVGDYRATVRRADSSEIPAACDDICSSRGARTIVVPCGLPAAWRPRAVDLVEGDPVTARELDAVDGVLTGCTVAIAETGTIVLTGSAHEGRRAITLIPDLHICVVTESQIVELVPEALELIARENLERRPLTLISGPSATSDIELSRVEGVHGPRTLFILVAKEPS